MTPIRFMLIAGEASGDLLAAELVMALKASPQLPGSPFPAEFFGAGGPQMAGAGVKLEIDLTEHAVFGISGVLAQYAKFRRFFWRLFRLALERQPDAIVLVDYSGFNRRFAHAIRKFVRTRSEVFHNWNPKIIYFVSPQVWASREARAYQLARDVDLLLSIFPFEKAWYATRIPQFRVEFVGHPLIDRYGNAEGGGRRAELHPMQGTFPLSAPEADLSKSAGRSAIAPRVSASATPLILLLPGSRKREVEAHLPLMIGVLNQIKTKQPLRARLVLPNAESMKWASPFLSAAPDVETSIGELAQSLAEAGLALASSGTVTLECAYFRVPTVVIYKTSWLTYLIARQIVRVPHIGMPNILAQEAIYPEFIQDQATIENVAKEAMDLLNNSDRRKRMKAKLSQVIDSLGSPGASARAAETILKLFPRERELNLK